MSTHRILLTFLSTLSIFQSVLMKYLEQKDPPLHLRVKAIIKDCAERNRKKELGYESVTGTVIMRCGLDYHGIDGLLTSACILPIFSIHENSAEESGQ
jgi:hypothetical protein